jgi:hypothetical protein
VRNSVVSAEKLKNQKMDLADRSQGFIKGLLVASKSLNPCLALPLSTGADLVLARNPSCRPMPLPPLTDRPAWLNIITEGSLAQEEPQELLFSYDTRDDFTSLRIRRAIENEISDRLQRYFQNRDASESRRIEGPFIGGERISAALTTIAKAMVNPESEDGILLREDFDAMLNRAWDRADQAERRYRKRLSKIPLAEIDASQPDTSRDETYPRPITWPKSNVDATEVICIARIDKDNRPLAEAKEKRRKALEMTLGGNTQQEIADAVGRTVRTIHNWQKQFNLKTKAALDTGQEE